MAADPRRRGRATGLTDRISERDMLDRLVEAVRAGQSRALVVRGDPGVGKTVLLDYLARRPSGYLSGAIPLAGRIEDTFRKAACLLTAAARLDRHRAVTRTDPDGRHVAPGAPRSRAGVPARDSTGATGPPRERP